MNSASQRIFFAGTTANAAATLTALSNDGFDVVGVLSRMDAPVGRKGIITPSPVSEAATILDLPLIKANRVGEQEVAAIRELKPQVGVVIAYGSLLNRSALEAMPLGWLNLHFSLLPAYRGAAPVQHALLNDEKTTGISIFRLDEGMDTGPILKSAALDITTDDNSASLLNKLTLLGIEGLEECLRLDLAKAVFSPQHNQGVSYAPKITRNDARIRPLEQSADQASAIIRAMNPEPMAWLEHGSQPFRILSATPTTGIVVEAGKVVKLANDVYLGCAVGTCLKLEVVQPSGKNAMAAASWHNGLKHDEEIWLS